MALSSYCNNLGTTAAALESLNSEMMMTNNYSELETELLGFCNGFDDHNLTNNSLIDPFFDCNEFFYPDDYFYTPDHHVLDYDVPPTLLISPEEFDPCPFPKRQKCYETPNNLVLTPSFFNGCAPVSCPVPQALMLPELIQAPEMVNFGANYAQTTSNATTSSVKEMGGNNNEQASSSGVSPQSIAARQRRRKITEKTQELGKLIPGGNKMNTAEMLQSASKYVKYLQASVAIFQSMDSFQENKIAEGSMEELQVLLQSSTVQEKLYLEEKCLVPIEFVKVLADHHDDKSEPSIHDDLIQLIQSENLGG